MDDEDIEVVNELYETLDWQDTELARLRAQVEQLTALLNEAPLNAMAFLVGFVEARIGSGMATNSVVEWTEKLNKEGLGK